jgi:hypothetical protein
MKNEQGIKNLNDIFLTALGSRIRTRKEASSGPKDYEMAPHTSISKGGNK